MKKLLMLSLLVFGTATMFAQQYNATDADSEVKFTIKNFGLNVNGSFKGLQGKIAFDPGNLAAASINVSVDAATVNTGNGARDKHLKKEEYFDVANHPKLTFVSSKLSAGTVPGTYNLQGTLTIKGISKQISFPFTAAAITNGYRFEGKFKINRRDFKVGGGSWVLSDDLTISLNVSAIK